MKKKTTTDENYVLGYLFELFVTEKVGLYRREQVVLQEAREAINSYNFSETSRSNDFCFQYAPMIFVPNAFTPNGENPIFKPTLSNVSASNYSFFIMNRWGQIIFETNDPSVGWNGNISNTGIMATNDVFLYVINFENEKKIKVNKRGFVTMVK